MRIVPCEEGVYGSGKKGLKKDRGRAQEGLRMGIGFKRVFKEESIGLLRTGVTGGSWIRVGRV